jgi:hypothetical protein
VSPEEEFEESQRQGRRREWTKKVLRTTSITSGIVTFVALFTGLTMMEVAILELVPVLEVFGRLLWYVFGAVAGTMGIVVARLAGGRRLAEIEKWEDARDQS